ncbi:hypothetical protein NMY22_g8107 [Coprinellus aureogranulatus]|nr:hypothetical protein NMY22_g8107 [Coprinellus aureogranulatus]
MQQPLSAAVARGNRRHVRRTTSVPAPVPPPSSPLPALPPLPMTSVVRKPTSRTPFAFQNHDMPESAGAPAGTSAPFKGHNRGLSIASSVDKIDEDLKEN